jgi:hypothetical protein
MAGVTGISLHLKIEIAHGQRGDPKAARHDLIRTPLSLLHRRFAKVGQIAARIKAGLGH